MDNRILRNLLTSTIVGITVFTGTTLYQRYEPTSELGEAKTEIRALYDIIDRKSKVMVNLEDDLNLAHLELDTLRDYVEALETPAAVIDPMEATVLLLSGNAKGSGTHIGDGLVLTARHVVGDEGTNVKVKFENGNKTEATVLWSSKKHDISLIEMKDFKDAPSMEIACRIPERGEEVRMFGNPGSLSFIETQGIIAGASHKTQSSTWDEVVPVDGTMSPGMSGGGTFDEEGKLVGVNVSIMMARGVGPEGDTTSTGISFIVSGEIICNLMGKSE